MPLSLRAYMHLARFFWGVLGTRFGSLEFQIGSLQVHTGYLTFSFKNNWLSSQFRYLVVSQRNRNGFWNGFTQFLKQQQRGFGQRNLSCCSISNRLKLITTWGFFGRRPKCFLNDRKKFSHFDQDVWKYLLKKQFLWRILIQLWDKWPICFSDQNVSAKKWPKCLSEKNLPRQTWTLTVT